MSGPSSRDIESVAVAVVGNPDGSLAVITRASAEATEAARWEIADLISRRGRRLAPDLLRGRAAELALSILATDQILSAVLDAAANDLEEDRPPFAACGPLDGACQTPRLDISLEAGWPHPSAEDEAWVENLVARRRSEGLSAEALARTLAEDAALQALLCADPRIPGGPDVRRRMAAVVPAIIRHGQALNPGWWGRDRPRRAADRPSRERVADADRPAILLGEGDRETLQRLALATLISEPRAASPLLREIERAGVVPDQDLPSQVVRLGACVEYADLGTGEVRKVRLVPHRRTQEPGALSVLTPLGSALIGLSVGQTIRWTDHFGLETIVTVRTVEYGART